MSKMLSEAMGEDKPFDFSDITTKEDLHKKIKHKDAPRAHSKRSNPHHDHVPSDTMDLLIETINESDLGWKADVCKLQKHHHLYQSSCDEEMVQLDAESESELYAFGDHPDFTNVLSEAQKF
jgi:hypothetical protein